MAQSKKERQKQKKRQARRKKIAHRQHQFHGDEILILPGDGRESMSEALIDFMEVDGQDWPDEQELRKVLVLGMAAWNAAIATGAARDDLIQKMVAAWPPEARAAGRAHLDALIKRKLALFPNNKRLMLSYTVTMTPTGPHVQVLSTLDEPNLR